MNVLDVAGLCKAYGSTTVLGGVGRNGGGKSTLFRILAGSEPPDAGRIATRRGATLAHLPQVPVLAPEATVRQVLASHLGEAWAGTLSGDRRELRDLSDELSALGVRLDVLLARWKDLEARR